MWPDKINDKKEIEMKGNMFAMTDTKTKCRNSEENLGILISLMNTSYQNVWYLFSLFINKMYLYLVLPLV